MTQAIVTYRNPDAVMSFKDQLHEKAQQARDRILKRDNKIIQSYCKKIKKDMIKAAENGQTFIHWVPMFYRNKWLSSILNKFVVKKWHKYCHQVCANMYLFDPSLNVKIIELASYNTSTTFELSISWEK